MQSLILSVMFLVVSTNLNAQISGADLRKIAQAFHDEYDAELAKKNEKFKINPDPKPEMVDFWLTLADVRASYGGYYDDDQKMFNHFLFLMGGYAQLKMSQDFFIATLCHELGHGIGGKPYKAYDEENTRVSVEGQSDYFAFRYCLPRMFRRIPPTKKITPVNAYTDGLCRTQPAASYEFCTRAFQAMEDERRFFKLNPQDPDTDYSKPDTTVVSETITDPYHYPSSQCRIDTMIHGILQKERPACWFKAN